MFTINLEKILIKQNTRLADGDDQRLINEYEKFDSYVDNEILDRVGLNKNLKEGRTIKKNLDASKMSTAKFDQSRVFHISQIKAVCIKYHLRFLQTEYYRGTIDTALPNKIVDFENKYNVKCDNHNTYVAAPAKSFELQKRPVDPLMFYAINDEYYYLIHKWGNDLSVFRRCLAILSNCWVSAFLVSFVFTLPLLMIPIQSADDKHTVYGFVYLIIAGAIGFITFLWNIICGGDEIAFRLVKQNDWDSEYES